MERAKAAGQPAQFTRYVDKCICTRCNTCIGEGGGVADEACLAQCFVSMGRFVVNTILCVIFCTAAFLLGWELKLADPLAYFFYWLGLPIGMHAFPSTTDLSQLWKAAPALAKKGNLLAILSLPLCAVLVVLNYGRVIWADLGYGIAVGVLGPIAVFRALARF